MVHRLRRDSQCVLVGKTTVVQDNPSLTVRRIPHEGDQPVRVILDPRLSLIADYEKYAVFTDGYKTIVYHCATEIPAQASDLPETVKLVSVACDASDSNPHRLSIKQVVNDLQSNQDIHHIMVEGGPLTARLFLEAGLVDRAVMVHADSVKFQQPYMAGLDDAKLAGGGLSKLGEAPCGVDRLVYWSRSGLEWPTEVLHDWP
jgi:riboflavin biosynthesis pyrimidine reductase